MNKMQKKKMNKMILIMFLILAIGTWFSKSVIGILYDFGYFNGEFDLGWWKPYIYDGLIPMDEATIDALKKRPLFLWMFTQFTWLTATVMIVFLLFRFYAFDDRVPKWLRWIRSQRTLSIIMIYEIIVLVIFWSTLSVSQIKNITGFLRIWEIGITIMVHAVLPILFTIYGVIFLIKDKKASLLREGFVLKGMLWPMIYCVYYVIVALTWHDPYPLTDFSNDFINSLFKMLGAILSIYVLIGLMMIGHNFILLRYNKTYNPVHDYDALEQREYIIEKITKKAGRKFIRKNKNFHNNIISVTHQINDLEKKLHEENKYHQHKKNKT